MKTTNENTFDSVRSGIGFTLLIMSLAACDQGTGLEIDTDSARASPGYNAGYDFGLKLAMMQQQQPGIEPDDAFKGLLDALSDTNQQISRTNLCARLQPAELEPAEAEYEPAESVQPSQTEARSHNISKTDFTKDDFAALNAKREGVVTLPSGVQYEVLKAGSGEPPRVDDAVVISYQTTYGDGTVIDTTDNGESLYIALDDIVIPGLREALLLMNTGARWQVVIPPSMGFTRSGNRMLRRRDLIYDIMLVSIDRALPVKAGE